MLVLLASTQVYIPYLEIPEIMLSRHLPIQCAAVRAGKLALAPKDLALHSIREVLGRYALACQSEMAIDWSKAIFNQYTLRGIYGRDMYETWYKMTVMLQSGLDIGGVITYRFAWNEFGAGFDAMRSGNSGKVLLDWPDVR